ncbi:MAG: PilX N-terminal domain-containing pilus assembly protein [Gammaproteobacteria bacterium]|nr:PilX N-terminal domain-containing pilus assembly protein [Gammaproteobacteria bacterium]
MQLKNQQQGIVLVICLVMLMVLTIMGVSSMSNTTLQLQIARNTQEQNTAFQTAEAGIRNAKEIADYTALRNPDPNVTYVPQSFNYVMPVSGLTATATTSHMGCTRRFGNSIDRAASQNVFVTEATGLSPGGSRSTVVSAVGKTTPVDCTK